MPPRYSKEINELLVNGFRKRQHRTSPCEAACPAGNRIQAMETLIKDGKNAEAHLMLLSKNPFSGITGRVCTHPCEGKCNRREYDEGLSIRALERFAADTAITPFIKAQQASGKKVAIIGSGPAGMTAAWYLRLLGHEVTVFEASSVLGGVPRTSIPDFRLPKNVPDRENGFILSFGVKAYANVKVGQDISIDNILNKYDACIVAVGNGSERRLAIPGMENALPAVKFLEDSNLSRKDLAGKSVLIIGGGGVAFDCAFTAKRLHAGKVCLLFPEDQNSIKAPAEEVDQAGEEGITLYPSRLSVQIEKNAVSAVKLNRFEFNEEGELIAEKDESDVLKVEADIIICASGLLPDIGFLDVLKPEKTPRGHLVSDKFGATSVKKLFAAGDIVTGPATVASAIGSGRMVAVGVHMALAGLDKMPELAFEDQEGSLYLAAKKPALEFEPHIVQFKEIENPTYHEHAPRRSVDLNKDISFLPFEEISLGFTPEKAQQEASRCMHCGHCIDCGTCVERCPNYILDKDEDGPFVSYPEECWHCACCRIGCPTGAINIEFPITMLV